MAEAPPLLPPQWWADRINAARRDIGPWPGLPPLSRLDGIVMTSWHIATRTPLPPLAALAIN